jgi:hypothetical protein
MLDKKCVEKLKYKGRAFMTALFLRKWAWKGGTVGSDRDLKGFVKCKNVYEPFVDVYCAEIPQSDDFQRVYPQAREDEIQATANPTVKRERYYVWKLLGYAVEKSFGKRLETCTVEKGASGKWRCDACEFSLSHSKNAVCVAVSKMPVGVDVERIELTRRDIAKAILSAEEYARYLELPQDEKTEFIIGAWTKKESLFKRKDVKSVTRDGFQGLNEPVFQTSIVVCGERYSLAVATDTANVRVYENIDLLKEN